MKKFLLPFLIGLQISSSWAVEDYERFQGPTQSIASSAVRYGGPLVLGAGGFFAGKQLGGSTSAGLVGAAAGVAAGIGLDMFSDGRSRRAYQQGLADGANKVRAARADYLWQREAIMGLAGEDSGSGSTRYRTSYVPARQVNGVILPGGYQTVQVAYGTYGAH